MSLFLLQVIGPDGKTLHTEKIELPCNTTEEALETKKVSNMKRESKYQNVGFRVKLLEE